MSHFSENKILTPLQHGFRSKHSCESQLLITTDEFIQILKARHKHMLLSCILVRPLTLSPTNASCTNLTTMEFGEQHVIGFKMLITPLQWFDGTGRYQNKPYTHHVSLYIHRRQADIPRPSV